MHEQPDVGGQAQDPQAWLLSFGDLVSLMLVFFVMLYAMGALKREEFEAVSSALSLRFNPAMEAPRLKPADEFSAPRIDLVEGHNLDYLRALIVEKAATEPSLAGLVVHQLDDRLVLSLPSAALFERASAALDAEARQGLRVLGDLLRYIANRVDVGGHTDPNPRRTGIFASNWELSLARALAVANELRRSGYSGAIGALGFAGTRYRDLSVRRPAERRYALANRVDVVVRDMKAEGSASDR